MEGGEVRGERNVPVPVRPICPFHVPVRSCGFPKRRFGENESKDRKNRRRFRKNRSKERNEGSSQRQGKKNAVAKKAVPTGMCGTASVRFVEHARLELATS